MLHLLNLLAAIALLVWGTHIVRTGMLRVFGENLRRVLAMSFSNRCAAALRSRRHQPRAVEHRHLPDRRVVRRQGPGDHCRGAGRDARRRRRHQPDGGRLLVRPVLAVAAADLRRRGAVHHAPDTAAPAAIGRVLIGLGLITLALQLIVAATRPLTAVAGGARPAGRAAERRAARHLRRRGADGAVVFEPGDRAADRDLGALRLAADRRRRSAWCSAPTSAAACWRCSPPPSRRVEVRPAAARQPDLQGRRRAARDPARCRGAHVLLQQLVPSLPSRW